ncbi:MAG: glycosyltransferase family 9 protein [Desulfamplus sp.]|nr:glycosyltransferase family 9 protein [Desulfamplus sp.]
MLKNINKILIIKPSAFGDIVHTLPFLNALKTGYPDAQIDWVVAHGLHTFLEGHPMIRRLWVIKKDQWKKLKYMKATFREIVELTKGLREEKYDVAVDLSGILRSGLIAFASGAKVKLGFEESNEGSPFFYSHKIKGDMNIHAIDRYLTLAGALGCPTDIIDYPFAPFNEETYSNINQERYSNFNQKRCSNVNQKRYLNTNEDIYSNKKPEIFKEFPQEYVVISPSAGKKANQWHASRFGELAARLPLPSIVISSPSDVAIATEVVKHSGGRAISIAGKTGLKELIPIIRKAAYFITNDTGPMHVAAALNVPVFAIFGPANPIRTGPYGDIHTVIQKKLDCIPCYAQKPCSHWKCMNDLTVEDVFNVISSCTS